MIMNNVYRNNSDEKTKGNIVVNDRNSDNGNMDRHECTKTFASEMSISIQVVGMVAR